MDVTTIGIDLAKHVFQVHAVDAAGRVVIRKALRRAQVIPFFRQAIALPRRHGSVRHVASLGA